jgi:hypothetical protein
MIELAAKAQGATDALIDEDIDHLYKRLALNLHAISGDPELSGNFDLEVQYDVETFGPLDDLADFGKRYYRKVEAQVHELITLLST